MVGLFQLLALVVPCLAWKEFTPTTIKPDDQMQIFPEVQEGNIQYSAANGIFPKGCRWRQAVEKLDGKDKDRTWYQYWDESNKKWLDERPEACIAPPLSEKDASEYKFFKGTPRSEVSCTDSYCEYKNLWYNNGRWFVLVDGGAHVNSWRMSRNQEMNSIHVSNASQFLSSVNYKIIPGDSLVFDFIYFIHPTAIGHWGEMMYPLFSILRKTEFKRPADTFVLLHLKRWHLMEWARAVMSVALGVNKELPPILLQEETENVFQQITQPLQGYGADDWLCFERALVLRDVFTGGGRTFHSQEDAQLFRELIYHQYGLPSPTQAPKLPPKTITFQRKSANRRVHNEDKLLAMLREFAPVNVVEFNISTPFYDQLKTISETGLFVSVHTSNLANVPFLPPGRAVVELIQRFWIWNGLDRSFKDQTQRMGDIHHFAWRARYKNETNYLDPRDTVRFAKWSARECLTEECVEASTRVDVTIDIDAVRNLLQSRMPLVWSGASVQDTDIPWPDQG